MKIVKRADLERARSEALASIDAAADAACPTRPVYEEKAREADAVLVNPKISVGLIPHIAAEAKALRQSRKKTAEAIVAARMEWRMRSAEVEARRVRTKREVRKAGTIKEIREALREWSL